MGIILKMFNKGYWVIVLEVDVFYIGNVDYDIVFLFKFFKNLNVMGFEFVWFIL